MRILQLCVATAGLAAGDYISTSQFATTCTGTPYTVGASSIGCIPSGGQSSMISCVSSSYATVATFNTTSCTGPSLSVVAYTPMAGSGVYALGTCAAGTPMGGFQGSSWSTCVLGAPAVPIGAAAAIFNYNAWNCPMASSASVTSYTAFTAASFGSCVLGVQGSMMVGCSHWGMTMNAYAGTNCSGAGVWNTQAPGCASAGGPTATQGTSQNVVCAYSSASALKLGLPAVAVAAAVILASLLGASW